MTTAIVINESITGATGDINVTGSFTAGTVQGSGFNVNSGGGINVNVSGSQISP